MKLFLAALIAFSSAYAADLVKAQQGTWKLDLSRSDFSNKPSGPPREATLTITDNGWTYRATGRSGKKTELHFDKQANSVSGSCKLSIKYEPTGNPSLGYASLRHSLRQGNRAEHDRCRARRQSASDLRFRYDFGREAVVRLYLFEEGALVAPWALPPIAQRPPCEMA